MIFKRLPVALVVLTSLAAAADPAGQHILVQTKSIDLDPPADPHRGGMYWSHGAFLFETVSFGLPPTFYTLDREGRLLSSVTLDIPESSNLWTSAFDREDDGSIIVAGGSYSAYGARAPFIALISADGRTERVIRTAPYHPHMLSVAPDGTFWTLGDETVNDNTSAQELSSDGRVLRHFDRAGKLLGSDLPQADFMKDYESERRLESGYLVATRSRLGWYGPHSGSGGGQYVEIDLDSMTLHSYPGLPDLPRLSLVTGFRLTESGNAFLSVYDNAAERATNFILDRAALKWVPIQGPATSKTLQSYLIGVDGEELVFRNVASATAMFFSLSR